MRRKRAIAAIVALALLVLLALVLSRHDNPGSEHPQERTPRDDGPPVDEGASDAPNRAVTPESAEIVVVPPLAPTGIRGTVVDEDGRVVSGALVTALERSRYQRGSRWSGPHRDQLVLALRILEEGQPLPGLVDRTAADGTFSLLDLEPGSYDLSARYPGKRTAREPQVEVRREEVTDVRLVLGPDSAISGHVLDPAGEPVPGARVLAAPLEEVHRLPYARLETTASGADGAFRVGGLFAGEAHVLLAQEPGGRLGHAIGIVPPAEDVRITVQPRVALAGVVLDDDTGEPLAGVELTVLLGRAVSDEDGRYELRGIVDDPILGMIRLVKDGYDPGLEWLGVVVSPDAGGPAPRDFRLSRVRTGTLRVTARDPSGTPLAGVAIEILAPRSRTVRARGRTTPAGEVVLEGLPVGGGFFSPVGHELRASLPGHVPVEVERNEDGSSHARLRECIGVSVPEVGEGSAEVVLAPIVPLVGRVRDPSGKALADVLVVFGDESTRSGRDGRFELGGLPRDLEVTLSIRKAGWVEREETAVPGGTAIEVTMQPGVRLCGRVLDADGRPVEGAQVSLTAANEGEGDWRGERTGADGIFRFEGLPPGAYDVHIGKVGYVEGFLPSVEVRTDDAPGELMIRLARGIEVEIVPVHPEGGMSDGVVYLNGPVHLPEKERHLRTAVRTEGSERGRGGHIPSKAIFRIVPGAYRIVVLPWPEDTACGAVETTVDLAVPGRVPVRLGTAPRRVTLAPMLLRGDSIRYVVIRRTDPAPRFGGPILPDAEGRCRSLPLPPGTYDLEIWLERAGDDRAHSHRLEGIEPGGDPIEVDLTDVR